MRWTAPCSTLGARSACQPLPPTAAAAAAAHRRRRPCRQRLALVSKRFAAAACSPELLREVDVGVVEGLQAMRSLTAWLARYSQHVRQLCIIAVGEELKDSDGVTAIASCVATAGAAGQLEQLELEGSFGSTEWLAAVRSLRHLGIVDSDHGLLPVSPAISGLTVLNSLDLRGELQLADTRLPGCITRLVVGDLSDEMPQQVSHCEPALMVLMTPEQHAQPEKRFGSNTCCWQLTTMPTLVCVQSCTCAPSGPCTAGCPPASSGAPGAAVLPLLGCQHGPAVEPGRQPHTAAR